MILISWPGFCRCWCTYTWLSGVGNHQQPNTLAIIKNIHCYISHSTLGYLFYQNIYFLASADLGNFMQKLCWLLVIALLRPTHKHKQRQSVGYRVGTTSTKSEKTYFRPVDCIKMNVYIWYSLSQIVISYFIKIPVYAVTNYSAIDIWDTWPESNAWFWPGKALCVF